MLTPLRPLPIIVIFLSICISSDLNFRPLLGDWFFSSNDKPEETSNDSFDSIGAK